MAGDARRPVAEHLLSDLRSQPVGADQRRTGHDIARGESRGDALAVLDVARDLTGRSQVNAGMAATGLKKDAVEVAAVHDGIRIAEALAEGFIQRNMRNLFAADGIHQTKPIDEDSHAARRIANSELVEAVESIRAELNAGTDLAKHRGAFKNDDVQAAPGHAQRGGEAAHAAAGDQKRLRLHVRHVRSPRP